MSRPNRVPTELPRWRRPLGQPVLSQRVLVRCAAFVMTAAVVAVSGVLMADSALARPMREPQTTAHVAASTPPEVLAPPSPALPSSGSQAQDSGLAAPAASSAPAAAEPLPPTTAASTDSVGPTVFSDPASSAGSADKSADKQAAPSQAVLKVYPTALWSGLPGALTQLRWVTIADGHAYQLAREIDSAVQEAVYDLGFALDVSSVLASSISIEEVTEGSMLDRAASSGRWVLSPQLVTNGRGVMLLRLILVPGGVRHAIMRQEQLQPGEATLLAALMVRDLINVGRGRGSTSPAIETTSSRAAPKLETASDGSSVLALSAAIYGGFVGYSLQVTSGSNDARLTYPLIAVGAGMGAGAAMLAAREWDITLADAGYMTGSVLWSTVGTTMLTAAYDVQPTSDRYGWAVGGSLIGLGLGGFGLSLKRATLFGGAMRHAGGVWGSVLGAGAEYAVRGSLTLVPRHGLGYGAIAGVVAGGVLAHTLDGELKRLLMVDLGAGLGGVAFAAIGSPLLISERTEAKTRAWVLLSGVGVLAGGLTAYWLTSDAGTSDTPDASGAARDGASRGLVTSAGYPILGVIATTERLGKPPVHAYGVGWAGRF